MVQMMMETMMVETMMVWNDDGGLVGRGDASLVSHVRVHCSDCASV